MKAIVNPFTREVELIHNDEQLTLYFDDLDEWCSFNFGEQIFDAHFHYDEVFSFSVYAVDEYTGEQYYQKNLITETQIELWKI